MRFITDLYDSFVHHADIAGRGLRRQVRLLACTLASVCVAGSICGPATICVPAAAAAADEVKATAPPNSVVLEHTRGGASFVSEPLKEEYDRLLERVRALRAELDAGQVTGPEVVRELNTLQPKLDKLRADIEKAKVLVSPLKVHSQTEETTFDLGPERLLVITADHVRLKGWEGPGVKCVLEKTVLAPDDKPVDEHLKGLRVVHLHGPAPEAVGRGAAERDAEERAFLATPDGVKLTEPQRKSRAELLREIAGGYAPYAAFQGKPVDTVEIAGLTHEQGNRQVTVRIESPQAGGTSLGSDWQRGAVLTVYVPACKAVAVRGCLGSLDVSGVHAPLVLTRDGSQDRDYHGTFRIRDVHGPLAAFDVPLDAVEDIHGTVTLNCSEELVNTGTTHGPEGRTLYIPPPRALSLRNIEGDLTASFTRADLKVEAIGGRIDVRNEFGNTMLIVPVPLADKAHRVVSESGLVTVRIAGIVLARLPFHALTNCGTIRTDVPQDVLEETSFSLGRDAGGAGRHWRGLKSLRKEKDDFFGTAERVKAIVEGGERSPGLDVISRGGAIRVQYEP